MLNLWGGDGDEALLNRAVIRAIFHHVGTGGFSM